MLLSDHHLNSDEIEICLDGRMGKEPKIWLGYPNQDGSQLIEEKELFWEDEIGIAENYIQ